MAKSYLNWGYVLPGPKRGAVVVFHRGNPWSSYGHVALCVANSYVYKEGKKYVPVFGGNQGDQACHKDYPASRLCRDKKTHELVAFRWPHDVTNSEVA